MSVGARIQLEFGLDSADPRVYATVVSVEAVTVTGGLALNDEYWKVFFSPDDPVRCETGIAAISLTNPDVVGYDEGYTTFWSVSKINSLARVAEEGLWLALWSAKRTCERTLTGCREMSFRTVFSTTRIACLLWPIASTSISCTITLRAYRPLRQMPSSLWVTYSVMGVTDEKVLSSITSGCTGTSEP